MIRDGWIEVGMNRESQSQAIATTQGSGDDKNMQEWDAGKGQTEGL